MEVEVIADLQFGSTGKGAIAAYLVGREKYDSSLRVQSIQAGHTVYYKGKPYKMRTIPCAWVDPNVILILGAGCFIDKQLLLDEIKMINEATGDDVRKRLFVDYRANYVLDEDVKEEQTRALEAGMGSTAHGAGASLIRKMWRLGHPSRVCDDDWATINHIQSGDTISFIQNQKVLVEGCQGALLALHTSPYYPFVTARECNVSGIIAEAGISPRDVTKIHGVYRSYPIRVGGNSGDTGGEEISWAEINRRAGRIVEPERTTVTNRVRRIFEFSREDFALACMINKPTNLYMTFADYLGPDVYGKTVWDEISIQSRAAIARRITDAYDVSSVKTEWIGTGEQSHHYIKFAE
jgi:adenylosuccinate synthase